MLHEASICSLWELFLLDKKQKADAEQFADAMEQVVQTFHTECTVFLNQLSFCLWRRFFFNTKYHLDLCGISKWYLPTYDVEVSPFMLRYIVYLAGLDSW